MHCYPLLFLSYFQVTRQGPARPQESAILKTRIFFTRADSCRLGHKSPGPEKRFQNDAVLDWLIGQSVKKYMCSFKAQVSLSTEYEF